MRQRLLDLVPMWFRTRWPLRRFYWQAEDLAAARAKAKTFWKDMGWE